MEPEITITIEVLTLAVDTPPKEAHGLEDWLRHNRYAFAPSTSNVRATDPPDGTINVVLE